MKRFIFFGWFYALFIFALPAQLTTQVPDPFPDYRVMGASARHKTIVSAKTAHSHKVVEARHCALEDLKVEIEIVSEQ